MSENVIEALEAAARRYPESPALRSKRAGVWHTIDWRGYRDQVMLAAKGLMSLGFEVGDGLVILSNNRPEWVVADLAAIAAGGMPTGLYTTATEEQCCYVTNHCEATVAVVENEGFLDQIAAARDRLKAVVVIEAEVEEKGCVSWARLLELGEEIDDAELRARIGEVDAEQPCTLIYTSGTTGAPKGVMLNHRNLIWMGEVLVEEFGVDSSHSAISYLPLSHVAEQVLTVFVPLMCGGCIWFAESLDALGENLREVRPTIFFGVPRVWEKIQARMTAAGASSGVLKRRLVAWARRVGLAGGYAAQKGGVPSFQHRLADRLVFQKVRKRLGFERVGLFITAAAPISLDTLEFFLSLGIPVLEVYGMTECTGPTTLSMPDRMKTGSAGYAVPGTELRTEDDGEICMRGPHIFLGYYKDPAATREALDGDAWLHSGDIGVIDDDGFLSIVDRKKELIVTSGGKNIAPVAIEVKLKSISGVSQAVVVGDARKYLTALLTLDPDQLPAMADRIGSSARSVAEASSCPDFAAFIEAEVARINENLAAYETIKRFKLLPGQLTVEDGTLTPTMKLKRRVIHELYREEIDELYADA